MAAYDTVGKAMKAVVQSLLGDIEELDRLASHARDDRDEANKSTVALEIFERNLEMAARGISCRRANNRTVLVQQKFERKAKANSVKVIQESLPLLARCRHQLPAKVLSEAVDSLSRPVAWSATHEIFDVLLRHVRRLIRNTTIINIVAETQRFSVRVHLGEGRSLILHLGRTCKTLQHIAVLVTRSRARLPDADPVR